MFGYLVASQGQLSDGDSLRYRGCYCGLCRTLRQRHGEMCGLSLSYDMTFLVFVLSSLYEPEERSGCGKCYVHPRNAREWWNNEFSEYAADMSVALTYLKLRDDWNDDGNLSAVVESLLLKNKYRQICEHYPRQCGALETGIKELSVLEKEHIEDPDACASCFGRIMGEIFAVGDDRWRDILYRIGENLGRFIYLMDACMDLDADALKNRFNPFRKYYGLDNSERFREILTLYLADCIYWLDKLPLVQDMKIINNVVCSGLWLQFNKKFNRENVNSDGSGSV